MSFSTLKSLKLKPAVGLYCPFMAVFSCHCTKVYEYPTLDNVGLTAGLVILPWYLMD